MPILAPYKMASSEVKKERSIVPLLRQAQRRAIGGKKVGVIAGPCSVESKQQLLEIAHAVKEAGAIGLRGGAFKPRTNPYAFQGLAEEGLKYLAEAREQTGLAIVTEVMAIEQIAAGRRVRRRAADRRAEHAELQPAQRGRRAAQAGAAQARHERDAGGVPAGGRVHHGARATTR